MLMLMDICADVLFTNAEDKKMADAMISCFISTLYFGFKIKPTDLRALLKNQKTLCQVQKSIDYI
jgi:hypothetical protein